jgi:hypothetical protein
MQPDTKSSADYASTIISVTYDSGVIESVTFTDHNPNGSTADTFPAAEQP